MGTIYFDGKSSQDYGIIVEHPPGYSYPERDLEVVHVPGRNGDLVLDHKSYKNVEREYDVAISSDIYNYPDAVNRLVSWLHPDNAYVRLEDSYEPDYYRLAYYVESGLVSCLKRRAGRAKIKFICKPQRFLKTGKMEQVETVEVLHEDHSSSTVVYLHKAVIHLYNPTRFIAFPKIKVKVVTNGTYGSHRMGLAFYPEAIDLDNYTADPISEIDFESFKSDSNVTNKFIGLDGTTYDVAQPIIDSELNDIYYFDNSISPKSHSYLSKVKIPDPIEYPDTTLEGVFPYLMPGHNSIVIDTSNASGVTQVTHTVEISITPNWWTL